MERGLSILWIDAICGSVQNSMTPPEKNVKPDCQLVLRMTHMGHEPKGRGRPPAGPLRADSGRSDISRATSQIDPKRTFSVLTAIDAI
jgi:hypothetical protein